MKPIDIVRAIFYPLTHAATLVPMIVFALLVSLGQWAGLLGLFLMIVVLPAVVRFQMIVLEARAKGAEPETPGVEFFNWFGNAWSLFPLLLVLLIIAGIVSAERTAGGAGVIAVVLVASAFLPASLAVLAITHSPLQSLNPIALGQFLTRSGGTFWLASVYLIVTAWLSLLAEPLPLLLANLVGQFLSLSFSCLTGSLIEPYNLIEDVSIPDTLEPGEDEIADEIEKSRGNILGHAYGFISRGNRDGGFQHIIDGIGNDPNPAAAWAWYFNRMLQWEESTHALFFAQLYVHDMLFHGENIPALKVIARCRLIDGAFRPKSADLQAAIQAANNSGNIELASVLKRH